MGAVSSSKLYFFSLIPVIGPRGTSNSKYLVDMFYLCYVIFYLGTFSFQNPSYFGADGKMSRIMPKNVIEAKN